MARHAACRPGSSHRRQNHQGRKRRIQRSLLQPRSGRQPINLDSVTLDGSGVKFVLKIAGLSYEGKLSADGKTIDGTSSQGGNPLPFVLPVPRPETAWEIPKPQPPPKPMAADADPSFEVATIKPNNTGATSMQGLMLRGRNFVTRASSLADLISFAYEASQADRERTGLVRERSIRHQRCRNRKAHRTLNRFGS